GGALSLLYRDGMTPAVQFQATFTADPMQQFDDVVALNDAGDVAFTGGLLFDNSLNSNFSTAGSSGVIVIHGGGSPLVGFPGEPIGGVAAAIAKVSSLDLGPNQGSIVAPPALLSDGKVIFFAQINGGSAQMILRADPVAQTLTSLVTLGGNGASATPAGGTYDSATSAPAVDTAGAITFTANIDGAITPQSLFWMPAAGSAQFISIGDAVRDAAKVCSGGPPFSPRKWNDAGDVVFRSSVAKGPALGIFRYRQGALQALVRIQDAAPLPPLKGATLPPRFTNLVGDPS